MLKTNQVHALGLKIAAELLQGDDERAFAHLKPYLGQKIPFAMLDRVGREFGKLPLSPLDAFLERLVFSESIGSWALLGTALAQHLDDDLSGALSRERTYAILGNLWYAADALGERVAGPALVKHFDAALGQMDAWRTDENRWVRRTIGVGVHVWAKRTHGSSLLQAERLLEFLSPLWSEHEMDAVKGIGWGLKTIGRYHPGLMQEWLQVQRVRPHRATMLRKATTYLPKQRVK